MKSPRLKNAFWIVPALAIAIVLGLGQRPNKKYPSPADPGMRLHGPKVRPSPEGPTPTDPNQGDIPDVDVHDDQNEFPVDWDAPLTVADVEVTLIEPGSDVGKPGDYMLVLHGKGFLEAERPPIVHIGDEVVLEEVYVNVGLGELYATLPASVANGLDLREFMELAVQNPGGMNRDPRTWVRFPVAKLEFLASIRKAEPASYKVNNYRIQKMK